MMAVLCCSAMFLTWLLFMTVLISPKGNSGLDKKVCSIVVVKGLDVNHYPTRISGATRRYVRVAVLPPALKCLAGLRLANITLCASYLVLLAGDIQQNPGPAKNCSCSNRRRNETCAGQTVKCGLCTKAVKRNQSRASCSLCLKIFHLRCYGSDVGELFAIHATFPTATGKLIVIKCDREILHSMLFPNFVNFLRRKALKFCTKTSEVC